MVLYILLGLVAVILVILALAARKPNEFALKRSTVINAPAEKVFPHVNDFHEWQSWSPWEKVDPTMERTYTGAPSGVGSVYGWTSKGKAGAGSMTITNSNSPKQILINLDFTAPFKASNKVDFSFAPQGGSTNVTWVMSGDMNFMMKVFQLFTNMDKMVGKDFELGLAQLKRLSES